MADYSLSQMVPVSKLPRNYLSLLKASQKKEEPIILMRHSKPVGAIVADKVLQKLLKIKQMWEEENALGLVEAGDKEFSRGETVARLSG